MIILWCKFHEFVPRCMTESNLETFSVLLALFEGNPPVADAHCTSTQHVLETYQCSGMNKLVRIDSWSGYLSITFVDLWILYNFIRVFKLLQGKIVSIYLLIITLVHGRKVHLVHLYVNNVLSTRRSTTDKYDDTYITPYHKISVIYALCWLLYTLLILIFRSLDTT